MSKKYLQIDENVSGDKIFYEGDTVVFELEATRYESYNKSDGSYFLPGESVALGRNAFSSLTRFDFLGSPESIFNYITIGSDGYARWEYTFLEDGIDEGSEEMAISMQANPHGYISFNLVINDPIDDGEATFAISGIYTAPGSISVAVVVSGKEILMCTSTLCVYSNQ
mgnify:CR=1 FL=1